MISCDVAPCEPRPIHSCFGVDSIFCNMICPPDLRVPVGSDMESAASAVEIYAESASQIIERFALSRCRAFPD